MRNFLAEGCQALTLVLDAIVTASQRPQRRFPSSLAVVSRSASYEAWGQAYFWRRPQARERAWAGSQRRGKLKTATHG